MIPVDRRSDDQSKSFLKGEGLKHLNSRILFFCNAHRNKITQCKPEKPIVTQQIKTVALLQLVTFGYFFFAR